MTLLVTSEFVQMTGRYRNNKMKGGVPRHVGDKEEIQNCGRKIESEYMTFGSVSTERR